MTPASKLFGTAVAVALALSPSGALRAQQQEGATPGEVVDRVQQAARHLAQEGEAGLETFRRKDSPFVWKDTYVVVFNCEEDRHLAHPLHLELEGTPLSTMTDKAGKAFVAEMCEAARRPQGGWVEYSWPRPGEREPARKLGYVRSVEGTPYQVTAGIYDEDVTMEELERISGGRQ